MPVDIVDSKKVTIQPRRFILTGLESGILLPSAVGSEAEFGDLRFLAAHSFARYFFALSANRAHICSRNRVSRLQSFSRVILQYFLPCIRNVR